jgi:hypothetical protein
MRRRRREEEDKRKLGKARILIGSERKMFNCMTTNNWSGNARSAPRAILV